MPSTLRTWTADYHTSLAHYHLKLIALAKTRAVVSLQNRNAATTHIAKMSVHVAMFHVLNSPSLNTITMHTTINIITLRKDARHVACQTSALTHHINILARTTTSSLQASHHGKVKCIRLT
jgi:purine nucleoside permease